MCTYQSIKSSVRLLLTSASNGLTLEQLNADYRCYYQSENIPYANFGYSSLLDFLRDMPDVAQFDTTCSPPLVYGIKSTVRRKRELLVIKTSPDVHSKSVKRLVLNQLSNNVRSTDHLTNQLTKLTMNSNYRPKPSSENARSHEVLTMSISSTDQYRILRCSNGQCYIPCFELSQMLQINEDCIDKETMFSRLRVYQSNQVFQTLEQLTKSCSHAKQHHRPYFFLFLASSVVPVLKLMKKDPYSYELALALEQFLAMSSE